jgi:hypothetical protein
LQLGLHAQFVFRFESRRNMKQFMLLEAHQKKKRLAGASLGLQGFAVFATSPICMGFQRFLISHYPQKYPLCEIARRCRINDTEIPQQSFSAHSQTTRRDHLLHAAPNISEPNQ